MKRTFGLCTLLILPLALTGCTGEPSDYFVLSPSAAQSTEASQTTRRNGVSVGVGPITMPEYLDRAEIVTRNGPTSLNIDNLARWGGSLTNNFQMVLGESLSTHLGTDRIHLYPWTTSDTLRYQIAVQVNAFEARANGQVVLDTRWTVLNPESNGVIRMGRSVLTETLPQAADGTPDYAEISTAMSRLTDRLGSEIAASGIR